MKLQQLDLLSRSSAISETPCKYITKLLRFQTWDVERDWKHARATRWTSPWISANSRDIHVNGKAFSRWRLRTRPKRHCRIQDCVLRPRRNEEISWIAKDTRNICKTINRPSNGCFVPENCKSVELVAIQRVRRVRHVTISLVVADPFVNTAFSTKMIRAEDWVIPEAPHCLENVNLTAFMKRRKRRERREKNREKRRRSKK